MIDSTNNPTTPTTEDQSRKIFTRRVGGFLRGTLLFLAIAIQLGIAIFLVYMMQHAAIWLYFAIQLIAVIDIFLLTEKRKNASYTMAWVLLILLLPVSGHLLYILWGRRIRHKEMSRTLARTSGYLVRDPAVEADLIEQHHERKRLVNYLARRGFPVYQRTTCDYYVLGDDQFPVMLKEIAAAKRFILISTFIVGKGTLWTQMKELLAQKVAEGVEVRFMYDDWGSLFTAPDRLDKDLKSIGVKVLRWGPILSSLSQVYANYRNHQKICIIDGEIAYTGGANVADEYININSPFGHWKDTGIRLEGDAVWSLTVTFLQMWEGETEREENFDKYRPQRTFPKSPGFYQPFSDGPMDSTTNPADVMYRSIINNAQEYVYIMTPYLIIDNSMVDALRTAALGGTDVRIFTPHIWDKWYVHIVTQSNYETLLSAGVKIYEYTPGYMHAKTILSDDDHCITGTINMDYRSFYLHYENAVWICGAPVLKDIKADFAETMAMCHEIKLEQWQNRPLLTKIIQKVFRIFAIFL
ncbi:MAG: cardiolipin synthase [Oscillospiraceae bacterium]|nr:cardiolipin synthase [Oscillospiraceae bacterium]